MQKVMHEEQESLCAGWDTTAQCWNRREVCIYLLAAFCLWSTTHTPVNTTQQLQLWISAALNQCCGRESFTHSSPLTPRQVKPGCGCGWGWWCLISASTHHTQGTSLSPLAAEQKVCWEKPRYHLDAVGGDGRAAKQRGGSGEVQGSTWQISKSHLLSKKVHSTLLWAGGCRRWKDKWRNPTFPHSLLASLWWGANRTKTQQTHLTQELNIPD